MLSILRGGYNAIHPISFSMSRPNGLDCYLFLIVKSNSRFQIAQNTFYVKTNSAVLIRPGVPYEYHSVEGEYINDWLHFTCYDSSFEEKYGMLFHHPILLHNTISFSQYVQHIIWEYNYADEAFRQENVSMLLQVLLNKLLGELKTDTFQRAYNPYTHKLQEIRLTMQTRPNENFTAEHFAGMLHISTSYFQHIYKDFFGIPFKADLIDLKLIYAQNLIQNSNLPFEQIALMCGYSNEVHFYRQFKAKLGMTPREYRLHDLTYENRKVPL